MRTEGDVSKCRCLLL